MPKSFDEFGGWLKFFYIILWLNFVSGVIALPLGVYLYANESDAAKSISALQLVDLSIVFFLLYALIKTYKVRSPTAHKNITSYLWALIALPLVFNLLEVFYLGADFEYPNSILATLIQLFYFQRSKRVKVFYGLTSEGNRGESSSPVFDAEREKAVAIGLLKMSAISLAVICIPILLFLALFYAT